MKGSSNSENLTYCDKKMKPNDNNKQFVIVSLVMVTVFSVVTLSTTLSVGIYFNSKLNIRSQELGKLQSEVSQLKAQVDSFKEETENFKEDILLREKRRVRFTRGRVSRADCCRASNRSSRGWSQRRTTTPGLPAIDARKEANRLPGPQGLQGDSATGAKNALVTYVRWGANSCPGGDGSGRVVGGLFNSDIYALHSQDDPVPGTDIICLPSPASTGGSSSTESLSLKPLGFRMDHLDSATYRNPTGGHLKCSFCRHAGTHVETLIGRTSCPNISWKLMYSGKYVTAAGTTAASSGICVSNRIDRPSTFPHQSGHIIATTIRSSNSASFPSTNKQIPCVVCVLNERTSPSTRSRFRVVPSEVERINNNQNSV